MIILKTHFFLLLQQKGTSLTSTLETQQASILSKVFLLDQLKIVIPSTNDRVALNSSERVALTGDDCVIRRAPNSLKCKIPVFY